MFATTGPASAGFGTVPSLDMIPSSFYNSATPMPNILQPPASGNPDDAMITVELPVQPLSDNAQLKYTKSFMFLLDTDRRLPEHEDYKVMTIWNLNHCLRKKAMESLAPVDLGKRRESEYASWMPTHIKGKSGKDGYERGLVDVIKEFGFAISRVGGDPEFTPGRFTTQFQTYGTQLYGEAHGLPNLWGRTISVGDEIGFVLTMVKLGPGGVGNWQTAHFDQPAPKAIADQLVPQIVPVVRHRSVSNYGEDDVRTNTRHVSYVDIANYHDVTDPTSDHLNYKEEYIREFEVGNGKATVLTERLVRPHYMHVGTVLRTNQSASDAETINARRAYDAHERMKTRRYTIDVILKPTHPKFHCF